MQEQEMGVEDQHEVEAEEVKTEAAEVAEEEATEEEITIGQPESPAGEEETEGNNPIRQMREAIKKRDRELLELKRLVQSTSQKQVEHEPQELPAKSLEDFDYDADSFNQYVEKRAESIIARREFLRKKEAEAQAANQTIQQRNALYQQQRATLKVPAEKMQDAHDTVANSLPIEVQNAILESDQSARLVYAIGNNSDVLSRLANMTNLGAVYRELGKLEAQLVVTPKRKAAVSPEKTLKQAGGPKTSIQARLDELSNSGNPADIAEYRRLKREHAAAK